MEKFAKSLAKVGHVLVSRIGWIMQWVAGTEGLDRSDHLRNFVPMERLVTMGMNGGWPYRISLVATPALMSASDIISLARVGVPAKALRTKHRYLKQCGNGPMQKFGVLTDRSHSSTPRPSSPLLEIKLDNVCD